MEAECPLRRAYRPQPYLFTGQRRLEQDVSVPAKGELEGSSELCAALGPWVYIEKWTDIELPELLTCTGTSPDHFHTEIIVSSQFPRNQTRKIIAKLQEGSEMQGTVVRVSTHLKVNLDLLPSDSVILTKCTDISRFPEARKVTIFPMNSIAGQIQPKRTDFPVLISPGLVCITSISMPPHPLFGDIYSEFAFYSIQTVNDSSEPTHSFRIGETTSLFLGVFTEGGRIQICRDIHPISPIFHTGKVQNTLEELMQIVMYEKRKNESCPVHVIGPKGSGKRAVTRLTALRCGFAYKETSLFDHTTLGALDKLFAEILEPTILHIRHFSQALKLMLWGQASESNKLQVAFQRYFQATRKHCLIVIASSQTSDLPGGFRNLFHVILDMELPGEAERLIALQELGKWYKVSLDWKTVSPQCVGKSYDDLLYLVERTVGAEDAMAEFTSHLNILRQRKGGAEGIPNVRWEDVGGLDHAKADIIDTIMLPMQRPDLFTSGVRQRSGLLLYGPPGTGKTLLAKAVATECSLNFIAVKGPELLNMYIGESEANIRAVFQRGRDARPCVLFFDELDSLAPARGTGSDSGGVMDRIVSQLLTELDGTQKTTGLYVIGATNRPDLLDPALLRPGRFDKMIYLGIASDVESKVKIVRALTCRMNLNEDCELEEVVKMCEGNFTGADFYALCSDALMLAYTEKTQVLESLLDAYNAEHYYAPSLDLNAFLQKHPEESRVELALRHFQTAAPRLTPSLTDTEIARYESLKSKLEQR